MWETDGAVPEIDKLIALSRLFGVSVGWLLGIEEEKEPAPERTGEISEELLRKIEEIVLRYRPKRQPMSAKKKVIIGIGAALVLCLSGTLLNKWSVERGMLMHTYANVDAINEQNAAILERLNGLEARVDEVQFLSVAEYSVDVEPHESLPAAVLSFHAVPSHWHNSYKATLVAQHEGKEYLSQTCYWNSSGLHATMQVDVQNGYEYWLVVEYPDGTKNQFPLKNEEAENLKTSFSLEFIMKDGYAEFDLQKGVAEFIDYDVEIWKSALLQKTPIGFKNFEFRLYERETPIDELTLLGSHPRYVSGDAKLTSIPIRPTSWENEFTLPLQESSNAHSVIYNLTLWVEMSNGMTDEKELGGWWFIDGELHSYVSAMDSATE